MNSINHQLFHLARTWKEGKTQFSDHALNDQDLCKLKEVVSLTEYTEQLLNNPELQETFFDWTLGQGNNVQPIVKFPETVNKIRECMLAERIGFYGGEGLQVEGDQLTLPFEGRRVNILDPEQEVTFRTGETFSIGQIFDIFKKRVYEVGELEYFQEGICHFNPKEWRIDLDAERWWEQLPVIENLSVSEANQRYDVNSDGTEWIFHVKASREHPSLDIEGTHGYLEVAIPQNGGYQVYYFGKFASQFPRTLWDYANVLTKVHEGVILYPDENIFNLHRQHEGHGAIATPEEGEAIMQSIRKDVLNAQKGNFKFQLISENCSLWVWKKLRHHLKEDRIPNLFGIPFESVEASGFIGKFFELIRSLPPKIRRIALWLIFFILGGFRSSTVVKKNGEIRKIGVLANPPWEPGTELYHPPSLFDRKK